MNKPDFIVIGAPKCGTTSFCNYLDQHPDIYMTKPKEPHYFSHDLIQPISYTDYMSLYADHEDKLCGEGSVWYLYSEVAAEEIKKHNPLTKIIIMLREPISFIQAVYYENLLCANEDVRRFEDAWNIEDLRRAGKNIPETPNRAVHPKFYFYRDIMNFSVQVERYINIFGEDNVYIILFDDLKDDAPRIYQEVLDFLNLDTSFVPSFKILNESTSIKNIEAYKFLRNPPAWLFKFGNMITPSFLKKTRRKVMWSAINYGKRKLVKKDRRPQISHELESEIRRYCLPNIEKLSSLIKRDLSSWY